MAGGVTMETSKQDNLWDRDKSSQEKSRWRDGDVER